MRIFITHIFPGEELLRTGLSVAATNFSLNLISNDAFDKVYSILPPFVRGDLNTRYKYGIEAVYSRLLRNAGFTRFAAVLEQAMTLCKIPKNSSVWLYNMTPLNGILVKLLRRFKPSVCIYTIVLDFTPEDLSSERWLPEINSCEGRITLSMSNRFNQENTICLPGVTPCEKRSWPKVTKPTREFIISGQLGDNISMLSELLPVFAAHADWTLNITGDAPEMAKEYSRRHGNIRCHGKVSFDKFLEILHKSPFLLSTRNPNMPENQCNFPSKIIEGLLHNRIIISTIYYPQLSTIKYLRVDADDLDAGLSEIASMPDSKLLKYANQAELTDSLFNAKRWAEEMEKIENNK